MATNLVSTLMQFVTPDLIAKIASALGLDRTIAQKAVGAGVPAILASLASLASKPGGAQQISSALTQQKSNTLDSLMSALGSSSQTARSEEGADMLSSLMGTGGLNALTSALSSYAGIGAGKTGTLLGLLGPMVMGALSQYQRRSGLDASSVASQLTSQQDQIAAALPPGFADKLRDSGFMDTLDRGMRRSAETVAATARRASDMSEAAIASSSRAAAATAQRTATTWPYWVAALAILAGLGWYYAAQRESTQVAEQKQTPPPAAETTGAGTPSQTVAQLTGQLTNQVDGMRTALQGITDSATAQAALPKLQQMSSELDKLSNAAMQLSPDARKTIATQISTAMPAFNQLCDKVLAIPGVAPIAKPVIDAVLSKLDNLARA